MSIIEKQKIEYPILKAKVQLIIDDINNKINSSKLQTEDDIYIYFYNKVNELLDTVFTPFFSGQSPEYLTYFTSDYWNNTFSKILEDLKLVLSNYEEMEQGITDKFNEVNIKLLDLTSNVKYLTSMLSTVSDYFYDVKTRYYWVENEFCNTSLLDVNSSFLDTPQCSFLPMEGAVTCPQKNYQSEMNLEVVKAVINPRSNGVAGNSILKYRTSPDDLMYISDGNPSTWFEYEKVTEEIDIEPLVFDVTFQLPKLYVVNNILLDLLNKNTQDFVTVEAFRTSLDGENWNDINTNDSNEEIIGDTKESAGIYSKSFNPRYAKYVNLRLSQGVPKRISSSTGSKYRYFIAIKDFYIRSIQHNSMGQVVSKLIELPTKYNYVSLLTEEEPNTNSAAYTFNYFVSPDEANSWYQVLPSGSKSREGIKKLLEFNTDSKDSITLPKTPSKLVFKAELVRNDSVFNNHYYGLINETELITKRYKSSRFIEYTPLDSDALEDSIAVEVSNLGSTGGDLKYKIGSSSSAPWQEFSIPFAIDNTNVSVYVSGKLWTQVSNLSNSSSTDLHYAINNTTPVIKFGDGNTGALPVGGIELSLSSDVVYFSSSTPHIASLRYTSDGTKENTSLYTISDYKFTKSKLVGKGVNVIDLGGTDIYSHTRESEVIPRRSPSFTLSKPLYIDSNIIFEDKKVFVNEVYLQADLKKVGDYYLQIDSNTRSCTVYVFSSTNAEYAGSVSYNSTGKLRNIKLSNSKPYDKIPYYTTVDNTTVSANEIIISSNSLIVPYSVVILHSKEASRLTTRVLGLRDIDDTSYSILTLDTTLPTEYIAGDNTKVSYLLSAYGVRSMAPVFSNTYVFKTEVLYEDGANELKEAGDYSLDYSNGQAYCFTPTSDEGVDSVSFYHRDSSLVPESAWGFADESLKPDTKSIILDPSSYPLVDSNVNYAIDPEGFSYIKPGSGCSPNAYTKVKYDDEFLNSPLTPIPIVCGSSSKANTSTIPEPYNPDGHPLSIIDWINLPAAATETINVSVSTNQPTYILDDTQVFTISLGNNTSDYQHIDLYLEVADPAGKFHRIFSSNGVYIPGDYFVEDLNVVDQIIEHNKIEGRYNIWFAAFKNGKQLLASNIASASFVYNSDNDTKAPGLAQDFTHWSSVKSTFVPSTDLLRGKYLPINTSSVDFNNLHVVPGTISFITTSSSAICIFSVDKNDTHFCQNAFKRKNLLSDNTYSGQYNNYCSNKSCPLYLDYTDYIGDLFSTEVDFINGAEEFSGIDEKAWAFDYNNGILYTSFDIPESVVARYTTSTHRVVYNITKPLPDKSYSVRNNSIKILDQDIINSNMDLIVKYRKLNTINNNASLLRDYFTPILKSYKLRIGRHKSE